MNVQTFLNDPHALGNTAGVLVAVLSALWLGSKSVKAAAATFYDIADRRLVHKQMKYQLVASRPAPKPTPMEEMTVAALRTLSAGMPSAAMPPTTSNVRTHDVVRFRANTAGTQIHGKPVMAGDVAEVLAVYPDTNTIAIKNGNNAKISEVDVIYRA